MKKNFYAILALASFAAMLIAACTKEKEYSDDFDIAYPLPVLSDFSPKEQFIDGEITITGNNLDKTNKVTVGANNAVATVLSKSATEVKVKLPRYITGPGLINLYTAYKNETVSKDNFTPKYPDTKITGWPDKIVRGQSFFIKAENGDQITSVDFGSAGKVKTEFGSGVPGGMNVLTETLTLPDEVVLTVTAFGNVINGQSPAIPVEDYDPNASYTAVDPILLFDFENGVNPVTDGIAGSQSGLNLNKDIPKGRGNQFLTIKNTNVQNQWGDVQGKFSATNIDLNGFHEPHLTFMVNTGSSSGYFQMSVQQGAITSGVHFKAGNSDVAADDYNFKTNGWEWRSINLATLDYENWGTGKLVFDKSKAIDAINLEFKQGNGGNGGNKDFEINLDHIMITDGYRNREAKSVVVWDFEDGLNPISASAPAITALNGSSVGLGHGNRFATVQTASIPSDWTWIASMEKSVNINMSAWKQPYLTFWVNTGDEKCYGQIAFKQNASEFGFEISPDFEPQATIGKWKFYRVKLEAAAASRWSGTDDFDPKGVLTNVKVGFTTGKVGAGKPYLFNLDELTVSDSPAW